MKKLSIFLLGALAFAATSCEDDPDLNAPIQSNPQGPVYSVEGVTAELPSETSFVLKDYADAGRNVPVANLLVTDFPADKQLNVVGYLCKDESFTSAREVSCSVVDNTVYITPDDFQNAYVACISKAPSAKDVYLRFAVYADNYRIGNEDSYLGAFKFNVTPFPSDLVIEDNYYLLGTVNGWSVPTALKMNHSDLSGYDDPIFTLVVDITPDQAADGWWWKIIPQSTFEAGNWTDLANSAYGPEENGSEDLSGMLMASSINADGSYKDAGAGCLSEFGTYLLTIDMIEGTYDFQLAIPHLYIMGDAAGWDWNSPLVAEMQTSDYVNYYAFARLSEGGYKFTSEKDWAATFNLGVDGTPTITDHNVEGKLANGGNNNVLPDITGLFWNHVNLPALTFDSYYIATLGLIGDCTPGGWDAETALTPSADGLVWEADVEFGASGEFKIRANNDWTFSLGGDMNNLGWDNAPNMPTPGAGKKHVVLNLTTYPYTITIQ